MHRPMSCLYIRLTFLSLLTMIGIICLFIVGMDHYAGVQLIVTDTPVEYEALYSSLTVMGFTSIIFVITMLFLMNERRCSDGDRREQDLAIDFPERRSNTERRG